MPVFGWRFDSGSAWPTAKLRVFPATPGYADRGIGGLFDSGATITTVTLGEQAPLRIQDSKSIPCPFKVADNDMVAGKLTVLQAFLEDDTDPSHCFRLPITVLPPAKAILIGRVGIWDHYEIRHDPEHWRTEFTWCPLNPDPPLPPGVVAKPPGWAQFYEDKVKQQLAAGRSWEAWEKAGRPADWLTHWK